MKRISVLLIALLVVSSCQEATQPSDLTATRTMSVEMRTTVGEPVADVEILWLKYTGLNAPISGAAITADDGFASLVIPYVATKRDSIRLTIDPPERPPFLGVDPFVFNLSACSDTLLSLSVSSLIACGTVNVTDTILLEGCPSGGDATVSTCRFYPTDCPRGLVFTAVDSSAGDLDITLTTVGSNSSAVQICALFTPASEDQLEQQFSTIVEGRDPTGGGVQIRIALTVIGRVNCEPCPCPEFAPLATTTDTVCVNDEKELVLPISTMSQPVQASTDCILDFTLEQPLNDQQFEVVGSGSFSIRGGQAPPDQTIRVRATQAGPMLRQMRWKVQTRRATGGATTDCEQRFVVDVTVPVVSGSCRVQPTTVDTLKKCVFSDSSKTDEITLFNDGDCEVTFDVSVDRSWFSTSPSGTVTVPPHSSTIVTVSIVVDKTDWDANPAPPTGPKGEKPFAATLRIRGCDTLDIPLNGVGWVICSAFKYQCLREFRPAQFPDVYAESIQLVENKTDIIYQNDNQTFKTYDIYIETITPVGPGFDIVLASGNDASGNNYGRFFRVATGFTINPGESICDKFPAIAQSECTSMKSNPGQGQNPSVVLNVGDVVLFVKEAGQQCALIWIQSAGPDRPGPNSLPAVCIEICYPVFTL